MTIYFYKACDAYGCFSNFSLHPIEMQGNYWKTVEHYYQAQKFVGSIDEKIIPVIQAAPTPEIAASLGRDCDRTIRSDWDLVKVEVMKRAVLQKFSIHADICEVLLNTGDQVLVEDSPRDYFWGCGANKSGQNQLGKILMEVRAEIRKYYQNQNEYNRHNLSNRQQLLIPDT